MMPEGPEPYTEIVLENYTLLQNAAICMQVLFLCNKVIYLLPLFIHVAVLHCIQLVQWDKCSVDL